MASDDGVKPIVRSEDERDPPVTSERLDSWKEIAAYLKRSVRTVRRWEPQEGLPVHRHQHHGSGSVYAFKNEIDAWLASRERLVADAPATSEEPAPARSRTIAWAARGAVMLAVVSLISWMGLPMLSSSQKGEIDPVAYALYLKGVGVAGNNYEGFRTAATYLEQAVAQDPTFARAYARLALVRVQFLFGSPMAPNEILPQVEDAAYRALALDPTLVEAHRALSTTRRVYRDFDGSDAHVDTLRKLAPDDSETLNHFMQQLLREKRNDEALLAAQRAVELDRLSANALLGVARVLRIAGQTEHAVNRLRRALELQPKQSNLMFQLGVTYVLMGNLTVGVGELEKAVALSPQRNARFLSYLGYAYAREGRGSDARRILEELVTRREHQYVSAFGIAMLEEALGDGAAARLEMKRAFDEHAIELTMLDVYPPIKVLQGVSSTIR